MYKEIFTSKRGHFEVYLETDHWGLSVNFGIDDFEDLYESTRRHIIEIRILLLNIAIIF